LSIAPLFTSPCDLAERIPLLVADFLDLETSLHRRFREESISDILVASLVRLSGPELVVLVPEDESKTGNDFDIIIVDAASNEAIQYRIQAKRLKPHATDWEKGSYTELAHPNGTGAQSLSLIRSAAAERSIRTIPLYAFYNPTRTCAASGGLVRGIELADGRAIRALVSELVRVKPKRPPLKRISTLRPLFFPLSRILCPDMTDDDGRIFIASPRASLTRVTQAIDEAANRFLSPLVKLRRRQISDLKLSGEKARSGTLRIPRKLPTFLRQAIERRNAEPSGRIITGRVERLRVVLFSG
jgi:hypothetical protein